MLKNLAIILLIGFGLLQVWNNYSRTKLIDKLTIENGALSDKLKSQTIIYKDKVIYKTRIQEKVVTQIKYLPPEGKVEIKTDLAGNTELTIKNKGFCIEPAISAFTTQEGVKFGISSRFFFWNRYGLGAGLSNELRPFAFVDRRINDLIPFINNTTLGLVYDGNIGLVLTVFL